MILRSHTVKAGTINVTNVFNVSTISLFLQRLLLSWTRDWSWTTWVWAAASTRTGLPGCSLSTITTQILRLASPRPKSSLAATSATTPQVSTASTSPGASGILRPSQALWECRCPAPTRHPRPAGPLPKRHCPPPGPACQYATPSSYHRAARPPREAVQVSCGKTSLVIEGLNLVQCSEHTVS